MVGVSGSGKTRDLRSGGKIVNKRYRRDNTTPYDRPPVSLQLSAKNSNWISDIIFPALRTIASGAAKIVSSVFDSDDDDDDSSLSSLDSTPASENDIDNDNYFESTDGFNCVNEDNGTTSEAAKSISKEPQLSSQRSDVNHVEQLLLKGKFSKHECNNFVQIIRSRVSGTSLEGGEAGVLTETLDGNLGSGVDDVCSKVVLEARKWLEKKNIGYSPASHLADGSDGLNSFLLEQIGNEVGSPADVAKLYMKSRLPWASLSAEHVDVRTPLTLTSPIFREELFSAGEESLSSIRKRASLASGSWNIQEEIRRVRLKATEDLLHSSPSTKIHKSSFVLSPKRGLDALATDLSIPSREDKGNKLKTLENIEPLDALRNIATTGSTDCGISTLEKIPDVAENETLKAIPATSISEKHRNLPSFKIPGEFTSSKSDSASPDFSKELGDEPRVIHLKDSPVDEISEINVAQNANGLSTSQAILSVGVGNEEVRGNENATNTTPVEDKCELLSEASVEVPIVHETESFDTFSHSPGVANEELSRMLSQPYAVEVVGEEFN